MIFKGLVKSPDATLKLHPSPLSQGQLFYNARLAGGPNQALP